MRPDEHLPELDKVAVVLVVDLDDTPGVAPASDLERRVDGGGKDGVGADDGKGNLGLEGEMRKEKGMC
jgi:hypothetical protein